MDIITMILYIVGCALSYLMLRTEHASEGKEYTYGARMLNIGMSLFSWLTVLFIITISWFKMIGKTGYWSKIIK